jgi:hypothetical protein
MTKRQKIAHMHRIHRKVRRLLSRSFTKTFKDPGEVMDHRLRIANLAKTYTIIRTMPIQTRAFPKGGPPAMVGTTGPEVVQMKDGSHRIL